jgi:CubicO group peptidase (beta-lactamase class C family)
MTGMSTPIGGSVQSGWESVRDAFARNWEGDDAEEVGASAAVYHHGVKVVDLHGGWWDATRSAPYTDDTLQIIFSTTKGITAIAAAMCVERGLLSYDEKVATYWPEFAAAGKQDVTVAQLLSHQTGLYSVDGSVSLEQALDWGWITQRLAEQSPLWEVGTTHGYHALTYGWLAGELIRRVDGRTPGAFVRDEIAGPLGVEMFIGLPEALESRVSPMIGALGGGDSPDMPEAIRAMIEQFMGPNSPGGRALFLQEAFRGDGTFNRRDVHAAEVPAANGISNAASLARVYAATIGEIDGVRLLQPSTVDRARTTVTPNGEPDLCLLMPTTFGMGFMTHGQFTPYAGPGSFGHPGAGGSVAFALPEEGLAVAYVMNKMASNLAGDPRAQRVINAALACAQTAG